MRVILVFIFFITFFSLQAQQQPPVKKGNKDFDQTQAPANEYKTPDMNDVLFTEDIVDTIAGGLNTGYTFDAEKDWSIIETDTSSWEEGEEVGEEEFVVVEVEEQQRVDSSWVTIAQYYSVWDTRMINPYKVDPAHFNDTIAMVLYDSLQGHSWSMPLTYSTINSPFGMRHVRWHYGTDLDLTVGDPVMACFDGIVRIVQYNANGYGYYVLIRHYNGFETLYAHLSRQDVKVGQNVKAGEVIGLGGNTGRSSGPHLHFEVRYAGNAFDPVFMYDFPNHTLRSSHFELIPQHYAYAKEARKVYYHTVKSGQTLSTISRKYGVSVSQICRLNSITTRTVIRAGRRLRIR
ncbi:MAG: peptidoglycan DD-metalloendopeptidase family protein [Cytophagales bacterium]|nr:peptidoglycan DD-metalloendopeptidase family protein [Cytophaga sp.]